MNIVTPSDPFTVQASYFKALAHPVRLQIMAILRQGEACVCHLEAILQKRQAYISQQLMVLREAGLLAERKEGLYVYYSLADPNLTTILDASLTAVQPHVVMELSPPLLDRCPCPHCAESHSSRYEEMN